MKVRVVVADDHAVVRSGLRAVLERPGDIEVVAEAGDGHAAAKAAETYRPDVVLMDIRMPVLDGIAATRRIRDRVPADTARVLMLTTFPDDINVLSSIRAGAAGFLVKDAPPDRLREAVRIIAGGDSLLSPHVTETVLREIAAGPGQDPDARDKVSGLTPRERELLTEIGRGRSNAEIAETLYLSPTTVRTYVSRLLTRLEVRDRAGLVVIAYEAGIVVPGSSR